MIQFDICTYYDNPVMMFKMRLVKLNNQVTAVRNLTRLPYQVPRVKSLLTFRINYIENQLPSEHSEYQWPSELMTFSINHLQSLMLSILAGGIQPGAGGVCDGGVDSLQVDRQCIL